MKSPIKKQLCSWILSVLLQVFSTAAAQDRLLIRIAMLSLDEKPQIPLSLIEFPINGLGLPGAEMAIKENNQTGLFTSQMFKFEHHIISEHNSIKQIVLNLKENNVKLIIANLPMAPLLNLADRLGNDGLIFNARAEDDVLRNQQCRANLLHTAASRSMKTDALAQYLIKKRWNKWLLIVGKYPQDKMYQEAIERSAKRFKGKIVETKEWTFDAGSRRTDSGHILAQQEVSVGTRGKNHDVLIVADEADEFGEYLPYLTDLPRPVAGTQGLIAINWHRTHEQWGGTQLQRRFHKFSGRDMKPRDYSAWMAVRAIGEATTRLKTADYVKIREFLLGDKFKLAAFKGVPLSFRDWNGQLRQPILVVGPRMLVTVSPQKKFLHEFSTLDTLGYDRPESSCDAFKQ